jgi:hypothetical protein
LYGISVCFDSTDFSRIEMDCTELTEIWTSGWSSNSLRGEDNTLSIRRPSWIVAEVRQTPNRLSCRSHDEDAAAITLRTEGNTLSVGGKGGFPIVTGGILRKIE